MFCIRMSVQLPSPQVFHISSCFIRLLFDTKGVEPFDDLWKAIFPALELLWLGEIHSSQESHSNKAESGVAHENESFLFHCHRRRFIYTMLFVHSRAFSKAKPNTQTRANREMKFQRNTKGMYYFPLGLTLFSPLWEHGTLISHLSYSPACLICSWHQVENILVSLFSCLCIPTA